MIVPNTKSYLLILWVKDRRGVGGKLQGLSSIQFEGLWRLDRHSLSRFDFHGGAWRQFDYLRLEISTRITSIIPFYYLSTDRIPNVPQNLTRTDFLAKQKAATVDEVSNQLGIALQPRPHPSCWEWMYDEFYFQNPMTYQQKKAPPKRCIDRGWKYMNRLWVKPLHPRRDGHQPHGKSASGQKGFDNVYQLRLSRGKRHLARTAAMRCTLFSLKDNCSGLETLQEEIIVWN